MIFDILKLLRVQVSGSGSRKLFRAQSWKSHHGERWKRNMAYHSIWGSFEAEEASIWGISFTDSEICAMASTEQKYAQH